MIKKCIHNNNILNKTRWKNVSLKFRVFSDFCRDYMGTLFWNITSRFGTIRSGSIYRWRQKRLKLSRRIRLNIKTVLTRNFELTFSDHKTLRCVVNDKIGSVDCSRVNLPMNATVIVDMLTHQFKHKKWKGWNKHIELRNCFLQSIHFIVTDFDVTEFLGNKFD